ncbi:uncharacterized acetyltransferase At3g50280-like [Setaria viridis]
MPSPAVRVASRRPHERIPLTYWDLALLPADYLQYGLLFAPPPISTADLVDHLQAALADALAVYYPVAGRLSTDQHRDGKGDVVGCSVSVDCAGQGVEILHAVADGVAVADVAPPDADVPAVVRSFFPLDGSINYEGHELPLFVVQVTDLADGVFVGFAYNHALSDGAALWDFVNAWARIARVRLAPLPRRPRFERWSPDGDSAAPVVLPLRYLAFLLTKTQSPPPELRERMLHFSAESLIALKERARQELVAAGDEAGAAAVTTFQALSSLLWRCVARAQRLRPEQETACRFAIDNRGRLRPPLSTGYFGNSVYAISAEAVGAADLQSRGHGNGVVIAGSPRFDVYGCDFGWGRPLAARSGRAAKYDGRVSLFPGREAGGSGDVEVALAPEHMTALENDGEFWAAVSPDATHQLARKMDH